MSDGDGILIVGGGAAAHAAARAVRDTGADDRVTMLSADARLPYFRPHLTKELITGAVASADVGLDDDWYAAAGVDVVLDCTVTGIDVAQRQVGSDRGPFGYDRLLVVTG